MSKSTINTKDYKFGLTGARKKTGLNYWRFFFNGIDVVSGGEQMFFVDFEMLNPWTSPSEVLLGFKPRVNLTSEDLQYALAGTQSARNLQSEDLVLPSYCVVRLGMLGQKTKQVCSYFPVRDINFNKKPFELRIGNTIFSEEKISGFINVSQEDKTAHPELMCESGYVTWDLKYEIKNQSVEGFSQKVCRWFPQGLKTAFTGKISFDGTDYLVDERHCNGYVERYWGSSLVEPWFHLSSASLTSVITGKTLFNSSFTVHGVFDNRLAFAGNFEGLEITLSADSSKKQYSAIWDCNQLLDNENPDESKLHWSVSLNSKNWIIDIDVYCHIKDLYNRKMELPEGSRKVLSMLEGGTGTGELKLYKRIGNTLEQIEHARLAKVVCEIGHNEEGEI